MTAFFMKIYTWPGIIPVGSIKPSAHNIMRSKNKATESAIRIERALTILFCLDCSLLFLRSMKNPAPPRLMRIPKNISPMIIFISSIMTGSI